MLTIGQKIPGFSINAYHLSKIRKIKSSDFKRKWLVVVFYPGDFSIVCPTELTKLAEDYDKFVRYGAEVLSISMDSALDHKTWHESSNALKKIKYIMGADPEGTIYRLFGLYNEEKWTSSRATFIFDPDGMLRAMELHDNRVGRSTKEILRKLAASIYVREHPDSLCPEGWEPGDPAINLKIEAAKIPKVKIGIEGLDSRLGGGLEKNKVFLLAGESGSGKTVFGLQFIYSGLDEGENAIYVAVHEKPEDIINDAKSFGWDLEEYLKSKKLIILDMSPYISKVDEGETLSVRQLMADLTKHIHENNAKRIVIDDSIDYIARHSAKSERETSEYIRRIILSMEENLGCTILITSSMPTGAKELSPSGMEERIVSGVLVMGTENENRTMNIKKMRGIYLERSRYSYRIDPKKGIVVQANNPGV